MSYHISNSSITSMISVISYHSYGNDLFPFTVEFTLISVHFSSNTSVAIPSGG